MPVDYAALAQRFGATPSDTPVPGGVDVSQASQPGTQQPIDYAALADKIRASSASPFDLGQVPPAPSASSPGGVTGAIAGLGRIVAPIGESIGSALAAGGAKKMEADTSARQSQLADTAQQIISNPKISPAMKLHALRAIQGSSDTGVIANSGAFDETPLQTVGKALGTLGTVGAGAAGAAVEGLGLTGFKALAAKALAEGTMSAGTFGLGGGLAAGKAGGELAVSTALGGALGAGGEYLGAGLSAAAKNLTEIGPAKFINSLIKPGLNEFRFGRDPGQGVVDEGIIANVLGKRMTPEQYQAALKDPVAAAKEVTGLWQKIAAKKIEIGQKIGAVLTHPENAGKTINVADLMKPFDDLKQRAVDTGDQALLTRASQVQDGITQIFKNDGGTLQKVGLKNLTMMTPKAAQELKTLIGDSTKWAGLPFDGEINQARVKFYQNINNAINTAIPEVKELNARYANMLTAEKAIEHRVSIQAKQNLIPLMDVIIGSAGAASKHGVAGLAGAAARELGGMAAVKTRAAQYLTKAGKIASSSLAQRTVAQLKAAAIAALTQGNPRP